MFPQPAERRHTVQVRIPLEGVEGAETIEMLGDKIHRFPVEIAIRYRFAERWVDGKRQVAAGESWTMTARTHFLPGTGERVQISQDDFRGAGGKDWTPDWVRELIRHYRPTF